MDSRNIAKSIIQTVLNNVMTRDTNDNTRGEIVEDVNSCIIRNNTSHDVPQILTVGEVRGILDESFYKRQYRLGYLRDIRRGHRIGNNAERNGTPRRFDEERMSSNFNRKTNMTWVNAPLSHMPLDYYVTNNVNRRADMERIASVDSHIQSKIWATRNQHPWFEIPAGIHVARTFARDESDVIYVDNMWEFLSLVSNTKLQLYSEDLPLFYIREPLLGRRWNMPGRARDILQAMNWWHIHGIMVPYDALDIPLETRFIRQLEEFLPPTFEWWEVQYFPAGVMAPLPPVLYYFYDRLKNGSEWEQELIGFIAEQEYAALFTASWWHQAERANRGFIVPQATIDWLTERLPSEYPIDGDTTNNGSNTKAEWVLARMEEVRRTHVSYHHEVLFPNTKLPPSYFVDVMRGTCYVDYDVSEGLIWFRDKSDGRMYVEEVAVEQSGWYQRNGMPTGSRLDQIRYTQHRQRTRNGGPRDIYGNRVFNYPRRSFLHQPQYNSDNPAGCGLGRHHTAIQGPHRGVARGRIDRNRRMMQPSGYNFIAQRSPERFHRPTVPMIPQICMSGSEAMQYPIGPMNRFRDWVQQMDVAIETERREQIAYNHRQNAAGNRHRNESQYVPRPFASWDNDSLRNYVIDLLHRNGVFTPSEGEIRNLQHQLGNMRGYAADLLPVALPPP